MFSEPLLQNFNGIPNMKCRRLIKKLLFSSCILFPVTAQTNLPVLANSARTDWEGSDASGSAAVDENCPVVVEHEDLTFDLPAWPDNDAEIAKAILEKPGMVRAVYDFYNPADYAVKATLVFPFGTFPSYGIADLKGETDDPEAAYADIFALNPNLYKIQVNGQDIDYTLRHTFVKNANSIDLQSALNTLTNSQPDPYLNQDTSVTIWTWDVKNKPEEEGPVIYGRASVPKTDGTWHIVPDDCAGHGGDDTSVMLDVFIQGNDQVILYILGHAPDLDISWTITDYDNQSIPEETCSLDHPETTTTTLSELVHMIYPRPEDISEQDWFQAVMDSLMVDGGSMSTVLPRQAQNSEQLKNQLMRWYEYELEFGPEEKLSNSVSAPLYPDVQTASTPPGLTLHYLLTPAKTWADFGSLHITFNGPQYILESSLDQEGTASWTQSQTGWEADLESLPDEDLSITFSSSRTPITKTQSSSSGRLSTILVAAGIFIFAGWLIIFLKRKQAEKRG